jgi:hypothetical protein
MVIIAAGKAINKLILNLSFKSITYDCVAAMVVSDIIDRLSQHRTSNRLQQSKVMTPLEVAKLTAIGPMQLAP